MRRAADAAAELTATCARPGGVAVGRVQALRLNREGGCNADLVGPHAPRGGVALAKEQQPRAVQSRWVRLVDHQSSGVLFRGAQSCRL